MGGKTLATIALIASNSGYKESEEGNGPTLIVAPLTVIGNWVGQITQHCAKDAFKILVFSQWTSVLDILARCLEQEEILYERLDGSMSRATRDAAMDNFRKIPDIP